MKATKLLIQQHEEVSALFERFEDAEGDDDKQAEIFEEIAANLAAHDAIERELFYPACKEALGEDEEVLEDALVEHGVVEFSIYKADVASPDAMASCMRVLREILDHHVGEEEAALFPKVEEVMSADELEALGHDMADRFALALEEDFRVAVRANLDQVLEGAVETEPVARVHAASELAEDGAGRDEEEGDNEVGVDDDDMEAGPDTDEMALMDVQATALDELPVEPAPASRQGVAARRQPSKSGTRATARR